MCNTLIYFAYWLFHLFFSVGWTLAFAVQYSSIPRCDPVIENHVNYTGTRLYPQFPEKHLSDWKSEQVANLAEEASRFTSEQDSRTKQGKR